MSDFELARRIGAKEERERLIKFLREKKVLRDSFFLDGLVIYTEDGALDITKAELEGESNE